MQTRNVFAMSFVALALAACGGGSGGTTEQPQPQPQPQPNSGPTNPVPFVLDTKLPHGVWNVTSVVQETDNGPVTTFGGTVVIMPDLIGGEEGDFHAFEYYTPVPTDTSAIQPRALLETCVINPARPGDGVNGADVLYSFSYFEPAAGDIFGREPIPGESDLMMTMDFTLFASVSDEEDEGRHFATAELEYVGAYDVNTLAELNTTLCDNAPEPQPEPPVTPQPEPVDTFPIGIWQSNSPRDILHSDPPEYGVPHAGDLMITTASFSGSSQISDIDFNSGCYHTDVGYPWEVPGQFDFLKDVPTYRFDLTGSYDGGLRIATTNIIEGPDDVTTWYYVGPVTTESEAAWLAEMSTRTNCDHDHEGGGA